MNIKGIGDEAPAGFVLEHFERPMPRRLNEVLNEVEDILKEGGIQRVHLELDKPITYERFVKEEEAREKKQQDDSGQMSLGDVARNVDLIECGLLSREKSDLFGGTMLELFTALALRRLYPTHFGVGSKTKLFSCLGLDELKYGSLEAFFGVPMVRDKHIPDDTGIVFAGPMPGGRVEQISMGFNILLYLEEDYRHERDPEEATGRGDSAGELGEADGALADGAGGINESLGRLRGDEDRQPS